MREDHPTEPRTERSGVSGPPTVPGERVWVDRLLRVARKRRRSVRGSEPAERFSAVENGWRLI